jgi:hypothetical protein
MKEFFDLDFCFKGERDYVHGSDIFNKLSDILHSSEIDNRSIDFSIHGISRSNITILTEKPADLTGIKFALKYAGENDSKGCLYGVENDRKIDCRYAYPEEIIVEKIESSENEFEAELYENSSFTFIENLLVLNKFLVNRIISNENGKWYFTKLQLKKTVSNDFLPLKLVFKNNFNYKFTKTEIFVNSESVGFVYFSLTRESK